MLLNNLLSRSIFKVKLKLPFDIYILSVTSDVVIGQFFIHDIGKLHKFVKIAVILHIIEKNNIQGVTKNYNKSNF